MTDRKIIDHEDCRKCGGAVPVHDRVGDGDEVRCLGCGWIHIWCVDESGAHLDDARPDDMEPA